MGLSLHCVSSDVRTKDAVILSGVSYLVALSVMPAGTAPALILVYDCTTAGEVAAGAKVLACVATDNALEGVGSKHFCPALPIKAVNGLYLAGFTAAADLVIVHCFSKDGSAVVAEPA